MEPGRWERIKLLLDGALEQPTHHRDEWLSAACASTPELLSDVRTLLGAAAFTDGFLESADRERADGEHRPDRRGDAGKLVSHYRLAEWVGAGGMGDVFRAEDLALGREAAVKLLPPNFSATLRRRLLSEAEASAKLQHPAIATFYEAGDADGETFIAMEFVRGGTLRERLRDGPLPPDEAVAIACCVLEALTHAHAAGLLHRDIKPENLITTGRGFAKLLDFGIALPFEVRDQTAMGTSPGGTTGTSAQQPLAGTLGYLAPEQIGHGRLDPRTDVFQVGLVLYEMLTGRRPFGSGSLIEWVGALMAGPPDVSPLERPTMPPGIAGIVRKALSRDPDRRYDGAAAFLRELRAAAEGRLAPHARRVVAVVEFENRTGNEGLEWLGSALAGSIGAELATLDDVSVAPRERVRQALSSVRQDTGVRDAMAACLRIGCGWLVSGEIRGSAEAGVEVATRLVDVATGSVAQTQQVRGPLADLFGLQRSLAVAVAHDLTGAVPAAVTPGRGTSLEVYEYFTRARLLIEGFGKGSLEDARELLERASSLDPRHVDTLAALATTYGLRAIANPNAADYQRAVDYADRAIAVESRHVTARVWKCYALSASGRIAEAEETIREALAIDPDDTEALYFAATLALLWKDDIDPKAAVALLQRAVERDETRGMWWLALGTAHRCLDHQREALYSFTRAQRLEGSRSRFATAGAAAYAGEMMRRDGRLDEAHAAAFAGLDAAERSDHAYRDTFRAHALAVIGRIALDQGNHLAAKTAFQQVLAQAAGRPYPRACGHFVVQALCGLARATGEGRFLADAVRLFGARATYNFGRFYGALDSDTQLELGVAANALGAAGERVRLE